MTQPSGLAVDASGAIYVAGVAAAGDDLGCGPLPADGAEIVKFTSTGDCVWVHPLETAGGIQLSQLGSTSAGDLGLAIAFDGTIDVGDGPRTGPDVVLVRLDAMNSLEWVKSLDATTDTGTARVGGFVFDTDGNAVFTVVGKSIDSGAGPVVGSGGDQSLFFATLDPSGAPIAVRPYPGGDCTVVALATNPTFYAAAINTTTGCDFGEGSLPLNSVETAILVSLYPVNPSYAGALYSSVPNGSAELSDIAAAPDGSFVAVGLFDGATATFGQEVIGGPGSFAIRGGAGGYRWLHGLTSPPSDVRATGVAVLDYNEPIVAGSYTGTLQLGSSTEVAAGSVDTFVARIDP